MLQKCFILLVQESAKTIDMASNLFSSMVNMGKAALDRIQVG
jgi:hypothetical protein